jgi:hypothetical protein
MIALQSFPQARTRPRALLPRCGGLQADDDAMAASAGF